MNCKTEALATVYYDLLSCNFSGIWVFQSIREGGHYW